MLGFQGSEYGCENFYEFFTIGYNRISCRWLKNGCIFHKPKPIPCFPGLFMSNIQLCLEVIP